MINNIKSLRLEVDGISHLTNNLRIKIFNDDNCKNEGCYPLSKECSYTYDSLILAKA